MVATVYMQKRASTYNTFRGLLVMVIQQPDGSSVRELISLATIWSVRFQDIGHGKVQFGGVRIGFMASNICINHKSSSSGKSKHSLRFTVEMISCDIACWLETPFRKKHSVTGCI